MGEHSRKKEGKRMFRAAVCDDDRCVREEVSRIIRGWNPEAQVDCFESGESLAEGYTPYHAVFLDIDMKGMNGIETGKWIRGRDKETKIVYLTAYQDYVSGAFGVHAFQYLLKPVKEAEICKVLEEIFSYIHTPENKPILDFQTVNGLLCLPAEKIYYFEYVNRRVEIVTSDGVYAMTEKIGKVAKRMESYGFSMPHQSFAVNMLHVQNVLAGRILLDNGMEIPLAQKRQKAWKQELIVYLSGRMGGTS